MDYPPVRIKCEAAEDDESLQDEDDSGGGGGGGGAGPGRVRRGPGARKKAKLKEPADMGVMSENQICVVCGDYASGFHYSALTCEACKSFFKRTVQDKHEYTCSGNFDCSVSKSMRKSCQYCRFQKCLVNGMLPQDVRMDRTRGGRKKCKRTSREQFDQLVEQIAVNTTSASTSASAAINLPVDLKEQQQQQQQQQQAPPQLQPQPQPPTWQQRNDASSGSASNATTPISQPPPSADDGDVAGSGDALESFIREAVANDALMRPLSVDNWPGQQGGQPAFTAAIREWFVRGLQSVVAWSNALKCLDAMLLQDRITLLSKNWFAILLIDTLARSSPYSGVVHFAANFVIGPAEAVACQVPQDFYSTLCGMLNSFDQLHLSRNEISMLKLLALFDHSVVDDIGIISRTESLRGATLRALYRVCAAKLDTNENSEQCDLYVSKLLLRQGFTVNLKMGLESWRSLEPPSPERCTDIISRGLGIQAISPAERSSPEDDCTSTDSCPDQFRSRVYYKTMRGGNGGGGIGGGSGPVTPQQQQLPHGLGDSPQLEPMPMPHHQHQQQHQLQQQQHYGGYIGGQQPGMMPDLSEENAFDSTDMLA